LKDHVTMTLWNRHREERSDVAIHACCPHCNPPMTSRQ